MMMTHTERLRLREKTLATIDKTYRTKKYLYWVNGAGELCRARLDELGTVDCEVEVIE